jgi:hypothetical protein
VHLRIGGGLRKALIVHRVEAVLTDDLGAKVKVCALDAVHIDNRAMDSGPDAELETDQLSD